MQNVTHDQSNDQFDKSQLRRWCIAIVAETKPDDIDNVKVFPVEHLNFEDGGVLETEKIDAVIPDKDGITKTSNSERKRWMMARWLPDGADGRQSAPDVVSGETVQLYRYGNSETVYWKTEFRERELRRLEHVVHAYSNLKSGRKEFDLTSSYGQTFSTKRKYVQIWTSKSDGEAYEYRLSINTKDSTVRLGDDVDNTFGINSDETEVYLRNASGTYLIEYEKYMTGYAETQICFRSAQIRLIAPSVVIGGGGSCKGNITINDWHVFTHVYADNNEAFASIGNKFESYSHYKDGDNLRKSNNTIVDETTTHTTKNTTQTANSSGSHNVNTPIANFSNEVRVGGTVTAGNFSAGGRSFNSWGDGVDGGLNNHESRVSSLETRVATLEQQVASLLARL